VNMNLHIRDDIFITTIFETDRNSYSKHLNATNVGEFMGSMPYPYLESHSDWWFKQLFERREKYGYDIDFAIRKNNELIGGIAIYDHNPQHIIGQNSDPDLDLPMGINKNTNHHWASLVYWIAHDFSGQGIMTDSVAKFVPYIMDRFQLIRLEATVWHPNVASIKILEKNGFILEGVCKKFHLKNGIYFDRLIFAKVL
jgi:ribosomal-protein-alanine N-acetyltransferase